MILRAERNINKLALASLILGIIVSIPFGLGILDVFMNLRVLYSLYLWTIDYRHFALIFCPLAIADIVLSVFVFTRSQRIKGASKMNVVFASVGVVAGCPYVLVVLAFILALLHAVPAP